jgi:hypothetical protein
MVVNEDSRISVETIAFEKGYARKKTDQVFE